MEKHLFTQLGLTDKQSQIYMALLSLGPSSVRHLAEHCDLNRGTTYDALKYLQELDLVYFHNKDSKQHFVAAHPNELHQLVRKQQDQLSHIDQELNKHIPELQALYNRGGERPVARYYDRKNLHVILEDVLRVCEEDEHQEYRIYSAAGLREYLYESFPTFSDVRIKKGIGVKVIAIGEGGDLRGLDERKWLDHQVSSPTYIMMYPGKTAYISLNAQQEPIGVVIENDGVYETQKLLFDSLWKTL
ncbi:TrmB family transcriptional regulator [Patescibacteria group bacterium]|nr:TrmB family transcriptional regulator [Patescibacteria group bacterium]MBU1722213.1 TrmB family transcriptional regulator [Patescibacteria group bacterium]MBU1901164.1 TrmB family transcriptional regulator [Patescibacteria group bacterium]